MILTSYTLKERIYVKRGYPISFFGGGGDGFTF